MYGDGLESLEGVTDSVLNEFFHHIDCKMGKEWTVNEDLVSCFLNIIFSLVNFK